MRTQKYEIYDFGLSDRPNFFLTKVLQKYRFFQHRDQVAFAYISTKDIRVILGQYNLNQKIEKLVYDGYIETNIIGTTRFNSPIMAFIPLRFNYSRSTITAPFVWDYYVARNNSFSDYAKEIIRRLRTTKILILDWDNIFLECHTAYAAKGGRQKYKDYVDNLKWIKEEVDYFNTSTNCIDYVKEDLFGQRIHSLISNLPKPMRKHVYISGSPTVEVDLCQSQPLILAWYLQRSIGDNSFSRTVHERDIYTYIQGELDLLNRDLAKTALFKMIFGTVDSLMAKEFYKLFPDTKNFIIQLKTTKDFSNPSVKVHSNLAFKMQRIETGLFKVVWSKLMANQIPYISIHDGLLVRVEDSDKVRKYMLNILMRNLGPTVKVS